MKTLTQKQTKFLNETVAHFNSKNRGLTDDECDCSYVAGCSIGRHIKSKKLRKKLDKVGTPVGDPYIFSLLPIKLKELGLEFLEKVQVLHDYFEYWDDKGLSEEGQVEVNKIRKQFNLPEK